MSNIDKARKLKAIMASKRKKVHATLKELILLLQCRETGDYNPIFKTKLYQKYGGEYCEYFSVVLELN